MVHISKGIVKAVWALSYINTIHYATFMSNLKPRTPFINPNKNPHIYETILSKRQQIKTYFESSKENLGLNGAPDIDPEPICETINPSYQPHIQGKKYYITNKICSYALFFLLLHEMAHNECDLKMPEKTEYGNTEYSDEEKRISQEIEKQCDKIAFEKYNSEILKKDTNSNNLAKIGLQIAMLFLIVKSFDQQSFDGDEHPESYKRIWDIMEPICKDNDEAWSVLVSILSFEFKDITQIKINQRKTYDSFKDVVYDYLELIKKYDMENLKTTIS